MEAIPLWLPVVFFLVAAAYSSVGFGGGSSYLAVLAFSAVAYNVIPQTALACNIVVAGIGVWHYSRRGHLDPRRVVPFIVLSIPMAYLGGRIAVGEQVFMMLLGGSLFIAGARMFLPQPGHGILSGLTRRQEWFAGMLIGAAIGFLSGVVGIGGGIFLAPILILAGWGDARKTAAAAALFILVNSLAGLAGQLAKGNNLDAMIVPLLVAVFLGGQVGARLGSHRLPVVGVRRLLSALILFVSVRVMWGAF